MRGWSQLVACALLMSAALSAAAAQSVDSPPRWTFSRSYLNLYSRSRTLVPPAERFSLDLNRLRFRVEGRPIARIAIDLQLDNEILLGSYLGTPQYALIKKRPPTTSLDLEHDYLANDNLLVRQQVYRAIVSWSIASTDIRIGRQRVPLGTGQFWSPLDLLNPIDPTRLERDYRSGVDAVRIEQKLAALGRVEGVYVPATDKTKSIAVVYLHGNTRGADYSLLAGTFRGDRAVGADFSSARGGLGLRAEATMTKPASGPQYGRALLGADYGFPNTLNLTAELYYNGQGSSNPARYDFASVVSGITLNVARYYGAAAATYEITPLAKVTLYVVLNADDWSSVLWPQVEYSMTANLDVAIGFQRFGGSGASEYGRLHNRLHGEVRWFF